MFDFDLRKEGDLTGLVGAAVEEVVRLTAMSVWAEAVKEAPVDHGRLKGSIVQGFERRDELSYRIYSGVEYAIAVHEGTGAREIVPVNKKALYWPGAAHPVARVMHPGTRPNPFLLRAMETTQGRMDEFVRKAIQHAVDSQ